MAKDSFIFHLENAEDLEDLSLEEQGMILGAMIRYSQTGEEPEFADRTLRSVWRPIFRRLKADKEAYEDKCRKNKESAEKRWADANASGEMRTHKTHIEKNAKNADSDSDTESDTESECTDVHSNERESAAFVRFWLAYPRKVGKKDARKAFERALKGGSVSVDRIIAAVEAQKHWDDWQRGYIPNPSTWLNQGRWDDEKQKDRQDPHQNRNTLSRNMSHTYDMAELTRRAKA